MSTVNLTNNYNHLIKRDKKNRKFVYEEDIYALDLNTEEKTKLTRYFKENGIDVKIHEITKEDRSSLVRDDNYGEVQSNSLEDVDLPVFKNTQELEEFLEYDFIPNHVKINKNKFGKNTSNSDEEYPVIRLFEILKLKLSELEVKYAIEYIQSKGIRITGTSPNYDSEFDGYDNIRTHDNIIQKYVESVYGTNTITSEENFNKFIEYNKTKDPKIREELILRNYRLVKYAAWKIAYRHNIDLKDAMGYGYEGLIYAVDNYEIYSDSTNYLSQASFSTYALKCIKGFIRRKLYADQDGLYPDSNMYYKFKKIMYIVEKDWGKRLYEAPEMFDSILDLFIEYYQYPKSKKAVFQNFFLRRFDELTKSDLASESLMEEPNYLQSVFDDELRLGIQRILEKNVTPREKMVLDSRYGLNGKKILSTKEISKILGISTSRVNQIEHRAYQKLRYFSYYDINCYWISINEAGEPAKRVKSEIS